MKQELKKILDDIESNEWHIDVKVRRLPSYWGKNQITVFHIVAGKRHGYKRIEYDSVKEVVKDFNEAIKYVE